jgi:hypothetical protein
MPQTGGERHPALIGERYMKEAIEHISCKRQAGASENS